MNHFGKFEINKNLKPQKYKMFLYKNKNEVIDNISDVCNVTQKISLGSVNELNFTIPYYLTREEIIENPLFNKIKYAYLIKFVYGNRTEWYTIERPDKQSSNFCKNIKCYSLPYKLKNIKLYNYEAVSYTIQEIISGNILDNKNGILKETNWTLGYVDEKLKNKRRGISINSETTILDAIFEVAKKFNAIIEWDTEKQTVNFYEEESYGEDKGLVIQYNKYLENIKVEENPDEMTTVLSVKGKDDISIGGINPTGQSYLADYSYFMYPFERDKNKNAIKHSDYMTDSLCHALLDFQEVVNKNKGKLRELIVKKTIYINAISQKEMQLADLQGEYDAIVGKLNIAQANDGYKDKIIKEKEIKFKQLENKKKEIELAKKQKQSIETQINSIKYILSEKVNFAPSQMSELKEFKIEKTYVNNNISDEKQLLLASQEYFRKIRQPKTIINIDIVNFLDIVEAQRDWDKLVLGDIITINYHKFGIDKVKARIIDIDIDFSNSTIKLTIANMGFEDDKTKVMNALYNSVGNSAIINDTKQEVSTVKDYVRELQQTLKNGLNGSKTKVIGGTNGTTVFDKNGLTSMSNANNKMQIKINDGTLQITNEGENHFKKFIDGNGLDINFLNGKLDSNSNVEIPSDNIITNGQSLKDKLGDLEKDKTDLEKEIDELANELVKQADEQIQKADELADYIDSLNDNFGLFKVETDKMFATKVSNEEFASYRIQTANEIADVVKSTDTKLESYRTQTAGMIADKVGSSEFNSYRIQTNKAIEDRVTSGDFTSYKLQTDNKIAMVVDGSGNINSASIALAISNNTSAISMIADRIEIKPNSGVIDFPNGTSIDTRDGYSNPYGQPNMIRLRADVYTYICIDGNNESTISLNFADGSGGSHGYWRFTKDALYKDGVKVL